MTVITYIEACNDLKALLDRMAEDADCTVISRRDALVMSLEYFNVIQETLHLVVISCRYHY